MSSANDASKLNSQKKSCGQAGGHRGGGERKQTSPQGGAAPVWGFYKAIKPTAGTCRSAMMQIGIHDGRAILANSLRWRLGAAIRHFVRSEQLIWSGCRRNWLAEAQLANRRFSVPDACVEGKLDQTRLGNSGMCSSLGLEEAPQVICLGAGWLGEYRFRFATALGLTD
ncbi:unnamed protein product [Protopolystoma xenopodis]|uniref:Uncharacterized protein n=1 Tax=Protopolystoma xenopodis TaxID=117903 RepID=A0A3S5CTL2_9PLAT|nr:unnamed protein product [Protopolystoma xenopodis]